MEVVALINDARAAGVDLRVSGGELVLHGPPSAAAVVRRIASEKAAVIAELAAIGEPEPGPPWPCGVCKTQAWRAVGGVHVICGFCYDKGSALMRGS